MHDTSGLSDPDARDLAAGEYVLGTLSREERTAFEAVLAVSPDLQRDVDEWREHLQILNDSLEAVSPPRHVWPRVRERIATPRVSRWQRADLWRGVSALATAAALVLAILVFVPDDTRISGNYAFVATAPNQQMGWIVNASNDGTMRVKAVKPGGMPDGMGCELWLMENGQPVSLGMMPIEGEVSMKLPERLLANISGADLMISIEPSSGAPGGKPSGAITDQGKLTPMSGQTFSL